MTSDREVLPKNVIPKLYDLTVKPDMEAFTFEGSVLIDLDVIEDSKSISSNVSEIEIQRIRIKHQDQYLPLDSFQVDEKNEILVIQLENEIVAGSKVTLCIDYVGVMNDKSAGFYRSSYVDQVSGEKKYMGVTQFEATDARKAFPCWDEPAIKSEFVVTLIIPKTLVGLSNMNEESREELGDENLVSIKFKKTPIMSTYLVAWIIGDLEYIEEMNDNNVLVRVYSTRGQSHLGRFSLNFASRTLAFFSEYFDQPYPLPKMDLVGVPDLVSEAMENWGLVTFRTAYLLFDETDSTIKTKQNVAYIVAHELAHQWFGNLVTMEWWSDLWLNEGFATWVGWRATDYLFPEWDIWSEFTLNESQVGLTLDGLRSSHPIEVPVKHPSEIAQIFDSISYSKGATVIRMIVKYLGESVFRNGMRKYLAKHKYGNAKTSDLWDSLSEVSAKSVGEIMASWTKCVGYPVLSVTVEKMDEHWNLEMAQNRFLNRGDAIAQDDETIWSIPLRLTTDSGIAYGTELLKNRSGTIEIPLNVSYFKFNYEQTGFYRVHYPMEWLERIGLAMQLGSFGVSDRMGIVSDLFSLSMSGRTPVSKVLEFLKNFENEDDYIVWCEITNRLNDILSIWWEEDEVVKRKLSLFIRNLYARQVSRLGFEPLDAENDKISLLRPLVLGMSGKCDDERVLKEARVRYERFIDGDSSAIHPNLRGVVFGLVIRNGGRPEFEQVLELYQNFTVPDLKIAALNSLGSSKDPSLLFLALELSKRDDIVRPQDCIYIFQSVANNPAGRRLGWQFVKDNWEFFNDRFFVFLLNQVVGFSTQQFSKLSDAEDVESFFSDRGISTIERTVHQSFEKIRANSAWLSCNKENVFEWLSDI